MNEVSVVTVIKEKRYVSDDARLLAEWDWEKNSPLNPCMVPLGSGKKVSWVCKTCNNQWEATVSNRSGRLSGCPYCVGKYPILGKTDLESQFPNIASQWDYDKNENLKPTDFTSKSSKKIWWICEKGHSWKSTIANRTNKTGCPYCAGRLPIIGETDLESQAPHVAAQWDYDKNGDLTPRDVKSKSNKKVWWKCEYGHSWCAAINHRTNGHGCPTCAKHLQKSFPETAIYYYVSKYIENVVQSYKSSKLGKFEFDIYIPSCKVAIEYDGKAYHGKIHSAERERRKYELAQKHKVFLIRVREGECSSPNCDTVVFTRLGEMNLNSLKYNEELARVINYLFKILEVPATITTTDIEKDQLSISSLLYQHTLQNEGLGELDCEWDYEKNYPLSPKMLSLGSNQKVYWKCANGHSWEASLKERSGGPNRKGTGCPYCSGNKVLTGFNDVASSFPELLKEWDYSRNTILPTKVSRGYNGGVWWICEKGHHWKARISSRVHLKTGCPYCSNRKVLQGYNDLQTLYPSLSSEWHPIKNDGLKPYSFVPGSHKKVWWICKKCGHTWCATIRDRVKGNGCPNCKKMQ